VGRSQSKEFWGETLEETEKIKRGEKGERGEEEGEGSAPRQKVAGLGQEQFGWEAA